MTPAEEIRRGVVVALRKLLGEGPPSTLDAAERKRRFDHLIDPMAL